MTSHEDNNNNSNELHEQNISSSPSKDKYTQVELLHDTTSTSTNLDLSNINDDTTMNSSNATTEIDNGCNSSSNNNDNNRISSNSSSKDSSIIKKNKLSVTLINISSGLNQFSNLSVQYFFKDILKTNPSQLSIINSIVIIPLIIRPIYGLITDMYPLNGYRRKSYIIICGCIDSLIWLIMAFCRHTIISAAICLVISSMCNSFTAVIVDAIVVEISKSEASTASKQTNNTNKKNKQSEHITKAFIYRFIGMLVSSILRAIVAQYFSVYTVFFIASWLPLLNVISGFNYYEEKVNEFVYTSSFEIPSEGRPMTGKEIETETETDKDNDNSDNSDNNDNSDNEHNNIIISSDKSDNNVHNNEHDNTQNNTIEPPQREPTLKAFISIIATKRILIPILFLIALTSTPSYMESSFYYLTDEKGFEPKSMGILTILLTILMIITMTTYKKYGHKIKAKRLIPICLVCSCISSCLFNVWMLCEWTNKAVVYFAISAYVAIKSIATMPVMNLACLICPKNFEGSVFSLFASSNNLGKALSNLGGSIIVVLFGVKKGQYSNFNIMIFVQNLLVLFPILVLKFTPQKYLTFEEGDMKGKDNGVEKVIEVHIEMRKKEENETANDKDIHGIEVNEEQLDQE